VLQGDDRGIIQRFNDPHDTNRSLLALISNRHAVDVDALANRSQAKASNVGSTCFAKFVVGSSGLNMPEQRLEALPFR